LHCGFCPGSNPGEQRFGTAPTFETARAAFEKALREYLPKCSEAVLRNGARTLPITPDGIVEASAGFRVRRRGNLQDREMISQPA
jgi:hypothetical protein